jgi:hypothetical protein
VIVLKIKLKVVVHRQEQELVERDRPPGEVDTWTSAVQHPSGPLQEFRPSGGGVARRARTERLLRPDPAPPQAALRQHDHSGDLPGELPQRGSPEGSDRRVGELHRDRQRVAHVHRPDPVPVLGADAGRTAESLDLLQQLPGGGPADLGVVRTVRQEHAVLPVPTRQQEVVREHLGHGAGLRQVQFEQVQRRESRRREQFPRFGSHSGSVDVHPVQRLHRFVSERRRGGHGDGVGRFALRPQLHHAPDDCRPAQVSEPVLAVLPTARPHQRHLPREDLQPPAEPVPAAAQLDRTGADAVRLGHSAGLSRLHPRHGVLLLQEFAAAVRHLPSDEALSQDAPGSDALPPDQLRPDELRQHVHLRAHVLLRGGVQDAGGEADQVAERPAGGGQAGGGVSQSHVECGDERRATAETQVQGQFRQVHRQRAGLPAGQVDEVETTRFSIFLCFYDVESRARRHDSVRKKFQFFGGITGRVLGLDRC